MANIFIIGNGFDLAHGLKTSYNDFRIYLQEEIFNTNKQNTSFINPRSLKKGEGLDLSETALLLANLITLTEGALWKDIETSLGKINYSYLLNDNNSKSDIVMLAKCIEMTMPQIRYLFKHWIKSIDVQNVEMNSNFFKFINPKTDLFFTFNYTNLLQKIYGAKNVCHVHGFSDNIIFGHGKDDILRLKPHRIEKEKILNEQSKSQKHKIERQNTFYQTSKIQYNEQQTAISYLTYDDVCLCMSELNYKNPFYQRLQLLKNKMMYGVERLSDLGISESTSKRKIRDFTILERRTIKRRNVKNDTPNNLIDYHIQNAHKSLRKDTQTAMERTNEYIAYSVNEEIKNIYSIGFSYSDIDMKAIQLINLVPHFAYIFNDFNEFEKQRFTNKMIQLGNKKSDIKFMKLI